MDHLQDKDGLKQYSEAMQKLATGPWAEQGGGRITWCVEVCDEYFSVGGALVKMIGKDLRRLGHDMQTLIPVELLPSSDADIERTVQEMFGSRKWKLLDIGSCYNPFSKFDKFEVTAIDIAPAHPTVLYCDFLSVDISESSTRSERKGEVAGNSINHIKAGSFDIVVFSLLLSYFPSTHQRLQCCINAYKALCLHGILLIITPDSSHQNRHAGMMKSWKQCIEAIGFHRWKYAKDTHLHCMAFRKTRTDIDYGSCLANHHMLYIPQDSHNEPTPIGEPQPSLTEPSTHFDLVELPFCDNTESDND